MAPVSVSLLSDPQSTAPPAMQGIKGFALHAGKFDMSFTRRQMVHKVLKVLTFL